MLVSVKTTNSDMDKFYTISAITPEGGHVIYETLDEVYARKMHSHLMGRQLNPNDMTHNVNVTVSYSS